MTKHVWSEIPSETLNPKANRQVIHAANLTIARLSLAKGAIVPRHSHVNEQVTTIESGRLIFRFDDREITLAAGDMLEIPSHVPHAVEALEATVAVDLFAPRRDDWIRGDDAYLR